VSSGYGSSSYHGHGGGLGPLLAGGAAAAYGAHRLSHHGHGHGGYGGGYGHYYGGGHGHGHGKHGKFKHGKFKHGHGFFGHHGKFKKWK
jgi:hypothetical protein